MIAGIGDLPRLQKRAQAPTLKLRQQSSGTEIERLPALFEGAAARLFSIHEHPPGFDPLPIGGTEAVGGREDFAVEGHQRAEFAGQNSFPKFYVHRRWGRGPTCGKPRVLPERRYPAARSTGGPRSPTSKLSREPPAFRRERAACRDAPTQV